MTDITYTASNTDLQAIDTFDPPVVSSLHYDIQVFSNSMLQNIRLDVDHDGVSTSEYQMGFTTSNTAPLVITTGITGATGYIYAQPTEANTKFKMIRSDINTDLYADNINSGRIISGNTGFGVVFGTNATSTARQTGNNRWTKGADLYGIAVEQLPYLSSDWISSDGGGIETVGNTVTITSGSYNPNFHYQEIPVEIGKTYKVFANCYYITADQINAKDDNLNAVGTPFIKVGTSAGSSDIFSFKPLTTPSSSESVFTPSSDKIYLSAGFGILNSQLVINSIYVVEVSPFNTYDHNLGTVYLKWDAVAANTTLMTFTSLDSTIQTVSISSDNNVIITCNSIVVNSGIQSTTNKLVYTYSDSLTTASLNGGLVSNTSVGMTGVYKLVFGVTPTEFSYTPTVLSNTSIVGVST